MRSGIDRLTDFDLREMAGARQAEARNPFYVLDSACS
jgi:hypothetical protein